MSGLSGLSGMTGLSGIMGVGNAAPGITVPGAQSATSNVALAITGTSITDTDSNPQTVTLSVSHGTITLASLTGLTGSGNGTNSLSYVGALAAINTAIATLTYTSTDYAGADTLSITTNDGTVTVGPSTVAITVTFAFTSLSGLLAVYDPNTLSYTDAGTTLATANDDVIYRQVASNNASLYVEHGTLNKRVILKIGANGKRALLGDGTNDVLQSPAGLEVSTGSVTLFALIRCPWTTAKYRPIIDVAYYSVTGIGLATAGSTAQDWLTKSFIGVGDGYTTGRAPRDVAPYGSLTDDTWHTVILVLSAARAELYLDGVLLTPTASSASAVPSITGTVHICGTDTTGDYSNGYHGPQGICNAAISTDQVALLHTLLTAQALT